MAQDPIALRSRLQRALRLLLTKLHGQMDLAVSATSPFVEGMIIDEMARTIADAIARELSDG